MADPKRAFLENADGLFFVDQTCIDCYTCMHLAPATFRELNDEHSIVYHQPETEEQKTKALRALLSCPTGSIGTRQPVPEVKSVRDSFPLLIAENVYFNGFHSPKSYGASSYFIVHNDPVTGAPQNWLIDSPKFLPSVVKAIETHGGLSYIFLTHRDDIGDSAQFASHFGAKRLIHQADLKAAPDAEIVLEGEDPIQFANQFMIIPVPGHSPGSCCLLYNNKFLFSGDHCWWHPESQTLETPRNIYWNKEIMIESHQRLLANHTFEWVLPGHGMGVNLKNPMQTI